MELTNGLVGLVGVVLGSVVVLAAERLRSRAENQRRIEERGDRRAEALASMYTDFLVAFDSALSRWKSYWESIRLKNERGWQFTETDEGTKLRYESERCFRQTVWKLRVHEQDREQKQLLEQIAPAFTMTIDDFDESDIVADQYESQARELREKAMKVVDRFQSLHLDE